MGEQIYQTMYVDPKHQPAVFDAVHTIKPDGTEQKFDFSKVIGPVPPESELPPNEHDCDTTDRRYYWTRKNWDVGHNAWDATYKTCLSPMSPHYGQIGLQFVTKNGTPCHVFLKLSAMFPDATITVFYEYEAGNELDWEKDVFKGGYMVENIKDWQDYDKYDRVMRGQPLDKEDLKRFPVEPVEYTPEEVVDFLNKQS